MIRTLHSRRRPFASHLNRCELLETRSLPSYLIPTPIPATTLTSSPTEIDVHFNEPIDPTTLSNYNWTTGLNDPTVPESDIVLLQVGPSGATTQLSNPTLTEAISPTDPSELIITISQPLQIGQYQVAISSQSFIASVTGDGDAMVWAGENDVFGSFTIAPPAPQVTLAGATALPAPNPSVQTVSGTLQFGPNQTGVTLYQFTLGPASLWQFGVQALTTSVGSTLEPTIALFGTSGNLIVATNQGPAGDPAEPYLFQGLAPGTYYLGVSDLNNVPGAPGGYNPRTGFIGANPTQSTDGAYSLSFTATPNPAPTKVISFQVNHADPASPNPTGLTLQFSGPLYFGAFAKDPMDVLSGAIRIVGSNGTTIPVSISSFNELTSTATYLFNSPPPSGLYTVMLSSGPTFSDLASRQPMNPNFRPGVLGQFFVQNAPQPQSPFDLGILYPSRVTGTSVAASSVVPAYKSLTETYRFFATEAGVYQLSCTTDSQVTISVVNSQGRVIASETQNPGIAPNTLFLSLNQGSYFLVLSHAAGASIVRGPGQIGPLSSLVIVDWALQLSSSDPESAIAAGDRPGSGTQSPPHLPDSIEFDGTCDIDTLGPRPIRLSEFGRRPHRLFGEYPGFSESAAGIHARGLASGHRAHIPQQPDWPARSRQRYRSHRRSGGSGWFRGLGCDGNSSGRGRSECRRRPRLRASRPRAHCYGRDDQLGPADRRASKRRRGVGAGRRSGRHDGRRAQERHRRAADVRPESRRPARSAHRCALGLASIHGRAPERTGQHGTPSPSRHGRLAHRCGDKPFGASLRTIVARCSLGNWSDGCAHVSIAGTCGELVGTRQVRRERLAIGQACAGSQGIARTAAHALLKRWTRVGPVSLSPLRAWALLEVRVRSLHARSDQRSRGDAVRGRSEPLPAF